MDKHFDNQYLDAFCDEISDENRLNQSSFLQLYNHGITHFTKYLEEEILYTLQNVETGKELYYVNYVKNKITKTPYFNIDESIIDKWLKKFDVQIKDFPFQNNNQVSQYLKVRYDAFYTDKSLSFDVWDLQLDFYAFACKKEAEKIINFINSLEQQQNDNSYQNNNSSNPKNDSVHYVESICVKIKEFNSLKLNVFDVNEKYNEETLKKEYNKKDLEQLKKLKKEISVKLNCLHKASLNDNYFYPDCPFTVFVDNFQKNIKSNVASDSLKFYKEKYGFYKFIDKNRFLVYKNESYYYHQFIENGVVDYNHIQKEKIYFLEERIRRLGSTPDIIRLKIPKNKKNITSSNKEKLNQVLKKIIDKIKDFDSRMSYYNRELEYNYNKGIDDDISLELKIDDLYKDVSYHVTKEIKKLQKISIEENFYFFDCPFDVYIENYIKRKKNYLKSRVDVDESDFIMAELNNSLSFNKVRFLEFNNKKYFYHNLINEESYFFKCIFKKREYLEHKLYNLGWDAILIEDHDNIPNHYAFEKNTNYRNEFLIKTEKEIKRENPVKPVVYNESTNTKQQDNNDKKNQLTANQAVILLDKIGFFTHKSIEHLSKNKQASIISKLIGRDKKNIGSYITKLETKKPSEAYSRDISTIDNLLEN